MKSEIVVLLLTHRWDLWIRRKLERLRAEIGDLADVVLLMQKSDATSSAIADSSDTGAAVSEFAPRQLTRDLDIPFLNGKSLVPGSTHFPVLDFARRAPHYRYFFLIEFDVDFSGNWRELVEEVAGASPDLATCHVRTFDQSPRWYWWRSFRPSEADRDWADDRGNLIKSFNPIYCISRRGIDWVEAAHRSGWVGHYEILFATIIKRHGGRILDLADEGFCAGREQDPLRFLTEARRSTMRWRPEVTPIEFSRRARGRTLFHPVKQDWYFDGSRIVSLLPPGSLE